MRIKIFAGLILSLILFNNIANFASIEANAIDYSSGENKIVVNIEGEGLAQPPDLTANAAVLINMESGEIVYEKNKDKVLFPASSVKIMSAIVALENINPEDLNNLTTISHYVVENTAGNGIDLKEGEQFKIIDLLSAMLMYGANDAALALAECAAGSVDKFVVKMNEKAIEIGCENTVFLNPHGMHVDGMYTSAGDIAKIALYASKIEKIMDITSSTKLEIAPTNKNPERRDYLNRNHFISKAQRTQYYYENARGINAGSTAEAGYCLCTTASRNSLSYLCVIMGATSTQIPNTDIETINSFVDARNILDWAFNIYSYRTVVEQNKQICTVKIELSANKDEISLVPDKDIQILLPQNADIAKEIEIKYHTYEENLFAPIQKGDVLGEITVSYKGEIIGSGKLLSTADVESSNILVIIEQIKGIISRVWFRASLIIFGVLLLAYIGFILTRGRKHERKRFY